MSTEVLTQTLVANTPANFSRGRVIFVQNATAAITIRVQQLQRKASQVVNLIGIGAGFKYKQEEAFQGFTVVSAVAQVVTLIISDEDIDITNSVSISGVAAVSEVPTSTLVSTQTAAIATGNAVTVAANAARKAITFTNPASVAQGTVFIQQVGKGAGFGVELQNGQFITYSGPTHIGAFDIRNDSGGNATINIDERS